MIYGNSKDPVWTEWNRICYSVSKELSGFYFSVLLLAYMKGNANLCRAIVRAGARLGVNNNQGVNIFNYQVATKQLLFRLLGKYHLLQWESISGLCLQDTLEERTLDT